MVQAPCLLSIPEQIEHSFHFSPHVDGPVITAVQHILELIIGAADPDMLSVLRDPFSIEFAPEDPALKTLEPLFDAISKEFLSHQIAQPGVCMSLLAALVMRIGRIRHRQGLTLEAGSTRKAQLIQKFRALVDERYREHAALGVYAEKLGVTVGHLTRLCREVLGMSALAVISERVVYEARRDLVYTSDPIKALAWKLGFEDEVYFSRFFKKHTGLSPGQFRQQGRDQVARKRR
ncbi:MAG TPA: helix-turn-helix domain-containing protein [Castellaniella sp.]|uniref:helix-turn-helix domain-containing protein n=1 Tax=Castellaniella sp. TaxID=1955812 RepID=UPI002F092B82